MAEATIVIWDVQHGNAAYIRTPNGKHIAVDLGVGSVKRSDSRFSPLLHLKQNYGVERLDLLVITHPHRDHLDDIGNMQAVRPRVLHRPTHLRPDDIRAGNQGKDTGVINSYLSFSGSYSQPVPPHEDMFNLENTDGLLLQTFTPTSSPTTNLNNHSIVLVVTYAGSKVIIPGDNEAQSWTELLRRADFQEAIRGTDVLLAPHHGRQAGFSAELFQHIKPSLVVISDGPASETNAADAYSRVVHQHGWPVDSRSSGRKSRRVLTTRRDGAVLIKLGRDNAWRNYLSVIAD
jgi:competence protein ComEC